MLSLLLEVYPRKILFCPCFLPGSIARSENRPLRQDLSQKGMKGNKEGRKQINLDQFSPSQVLKERNVVQKARQKFYDNLRSEERRVGKV